MILSFSHFVQFESLAFDKHLVFESGVVINELMASNQNAVTDPAGEFDDWIELFNNTNNDVDLSGHFLSDNPENLKKWEFPDETKIAKNGYLIVWADEDGDKDQEGLHANFKLAKAGEVLFLVSPDSIVIDQVIFGVQETDKSLARMPNGMGDFQIKNATFSFNNDDAVATNEIDDFSIKAFPNPTNDFINVQLSQSKGKAFPITISSNQGQLVFKSEINGFLRIDVREFPSGIYLGKINNTTFNIQINH